WLRKMCCGNAVTARPHEQKRPKGVFTNGRVFFVGNAVTARPDFFVKNSGNQENPNPAVSPQPKAAFSFETERLSRKPQQTDFRNNIQIMTPIMSSTAYSCNHHRKNNKKTEKTIVNMIDTTR
ncbi:MAG: hypothetical protein J5531_04495, partial [Lachnospiraceae bacterium]|nr:hypothetical protein [Lachnospiraceae bacterium]